MTRSGGGVLGDDGIDGIQIGSDYPGSIYREFQAALLGYRERGFLLAIASKNDEATVREALDTHPEMILRSEHFAHIEANWDPKPINLPKIADKLNIGLDSLVFIDNNPLERAQVMAELPTVRVIDLPNDSVGYLAALHATPYLDRPRLLTEDRERAEMYSTESQRETFHMETRSVSEFLTELNMEVEVGTMDAGSVQRVHHLIQKTNQFNLTTRRHTTEDIRVMAEDSGDQVCWLRLADRFGGYGIVAAGIARKVDDVTWRIDSFVMSCRVMGKSVEDAFLAYLAERCQKKGARFLRGEYIPTPKNHIVADFYLNRGFGNVASAEDGIHLFEIELSETSLSWPDFIERKSI
jgi:FkbH-like protein